MSERYTITAALPYTNGPIHIGHLAGVYVPADIAGTFEKNMAISVLFLYFIFASVALAKNPFGAHIPPFIIFILSPYILLRLTILLWQASSPV